MGIKLIFKWQSDKRRKTPVPALAGLWLEGYGWLLGGTTSGDFQIVHELPASPEMRTAIGEAVRHFAQHGNLLPVIRRKNDPEAD